MHFMVMQLIFSICLLRCSGEGVPFGLDPETPVNSPGGSGDAEREPVISEPAETTTAQIRTIDTEGPTGRLCFERSDLDRLPVIENELQVDGDLSDWGTTPFLIQDPGGDAAAIDVREVALALVKHGTQSRLAIALKGEDFSSLGQHHIYFRFGSLLKNEADGHKTSFRYLREYRLASGVLSRKVDGQYVSLAPEKFQYALTQAGFFELVLDKAELDEVLLQPLWSFDVEIQGSNPGMVEHTGRFFFKNILSYPTGYETHICHFRMGSQTVWFQEIVDESLLREGEKDSLYENDRDQRRLRIERMLAVVREATESGWILLGKPINQSMHFPVVISRDDEQRSMSIPDLEVEPHLHLKMSDLSSINPYFYKAVYEKTVSHVVQHFVNQQLPTSKSFLRYMMASILSEYIHKARLGFKYWLELYHAKTQVFTTQEDTQTPTGFVEWQRRFDEEGLTSEAQEYFVSKLMSFSMILAQQLPTSHILSVLRIAKEDFGNQGLDLSYSELFSLIEQRALPGFLDKVSSFYHGWFESSSYLDAHSPFLLSDEDMDGLPRFIEEAIGTNPGREDTDRDGWTDLAEVYALTDPRSASSRPTGIMADGSFGDWQELIPDLVRSDIGANSAGCPAAADISHYSALYDRGYIIFAAAARDVWTTPPFVRWEVQVSVPTSLGEKLYTLRTVRNRHYYDVLEGTDRRTVLRYPSAKPLGMDSMEWLLDLKAIGLDPQQFDETNFSIRYRISTLFEDDKRLLCDDTPWTQPLYSLSK